jgi:restriction endonuclease
MNNSKALNDILTKEKDIPFLIDTLMKDIDDMKNEDGYFSHYYENIDSILGLEVEKTR